MFWFWVGFFTLISLLLFLDLFTFAQFKVTAEFQHRVLFWGILGAVIFRIAMLGGGVWLAHHFEWIFYVFGAWLAYKGGELLLKFVGKIEKENDKQPWLVRTLRRIISVEDDHRGRFVLREKHRFVVTTLALCLITVELQDIGFALDSIPAVLSISNDSFIIITSNIFAILGLRSLYFVLAGMMTKFKYLELALGVLLVAIGAKLALHDYFQVTQLQSLIAIGVILTAGVAA